MNSDTARIHNGRLQRFVRGEWRDVRYRIINRHRIDLETMTVGARHFASLEDAEAWCDANPTSAPEPRDTGSGGEAH